MVEVLPLTIPSLSGRKKRRVYVYLPEEAKKDPKARFPVLYMLDGQNVFLDSEASFGRSWRMYEFLNWSGAPVIVVAVESNPRGNNRRG